MKTNFNAYFESAALATFLGACSASPVSIGYHDAGSNDVVVVFDGETMADAARTTDSGTADEPDDAGTVIDVSVADAGPFMCTGSNGSVITCDGRSQYCEVSVGGAIGKTWAPQCSDFPTACLSNRTCECLNGVGAANPCEDNGGDITVNIGLP